MTRGRTRQVGAVAALIASAVAGCSPSLDSASSSGDPAAEITVYAAASLSLAFTTIGEQFQAAHPGTSVRFNFAGSADLVSQLQQGAAADVFASADEANMQKAVAAQLARGTPKAFATNSMMIAVPPDNPAHIASFADVGKPGVQTVVCAPQVPCGAATVQVEENTGTQLHPVSEESSVSDVLGKVASGEADAGIVYLTDVKNAGDAVKGIGIPNADNAVNTYPIVVLRSGAAPGPAAEFEAYVLGRAGQKVLSDAGFGAP